MVALRRRGSEGSDLSALPAPVNLALHGVVAVERVLSGLRRLPGVSLMLTAHRPP